MLGKKILAVIFAALVMIKLTLLLIMPQPWLGMAQTFLGYSAALTVFYLIALIITGYFVFTTMHLVDVAVVMLFTGLLGGSQSVTLRGSALTGRAAGCGLRPGQSLAIMAYLDSHLPGRALPGICPARGAVAVVWGKGVKLSFRFSSTPTISLPFD